MNAPASIRLEETDRERTYRASISMHCPNQSELDMASRIDIAVMRDGAASGMFRATDAAATLLHVATTVAAAWVYAPATSAQLLKTRSALRQTMDAARALERATR